MRHLFLCSLLLASCTTPVTDQFAREKADTASGYCQQAIQTVEELRQQGLASPDLHALLLRIDAAETEIAAVKARMTSGPKIPHLVFKDGPDGDLGLYLTPTSAFNVAVAAEVDYSRAAELWYEQPACAGQDSIATFQFARPTTGVVGVTGTIWKPLAGEPLTITVRSVLGNGGQCSDVNSSNQSVYPVIDTGVHARWFDAKELYADPR